MNTFVIIESHSHKAAGNTVQYYERRTQIQAQDYDTAELFAKQHRIHPATKIWISGRNFVRRDVQ